MSTNPQHDPTDVPSWLDNVQNPYLHGVYAPTVHETTAFDLEVWLFRAQEIERGPITRIKLPARIPPGFHAKWIRGDELWGAH